MPKAYVLISLPWCWDIGQITANMTTGRDQDNWSTTARKGSSTIYPASQHGGSPSANPHPKQGTQMSGGGQDKASQQDHDLIGFGSQFNTQWYDHALFHS